MSTIITLNGRRWIDGIDVCPVQDCLKPQCDHTVVEPEMPETVIVDGGLCVRREVETPDGPQIVTLCASCLEDAGACDRTNRTGGAARCEGDDE